jgi:hypothetical protein
MNITEQQIAQALEGHFYTLIFEPSVHVVDVTPVTRKNCIMGKTWKDDEYRTLWRLKNQGWTLEVCAEALDRSHGATAKVWSHRRQWMHRIVRAGEAA